MRSSIRLAAWLVTLVASACSFDLSRSDGTTPRPGDAPGAERRLDAPGAELRLDAPFLPDGVSRELPRDDVRDLRKSDTRKPDLFFCTVDTQCDDGDPCTVNSCKNGGCTYPQKCTLANQICNKGTCACKAGTISCSGSCVTGQCCSGQKRSCDRCGTEDCVNNQWAGCTGQKDCNQGEGCECNDSPSCASGPCAGCNYKQKKVCNPDCQWGGCFG